LSLEHSFSYRRHGRYFLSEKPGAQHRHLCFVLHGHGHLPQYFLKKFTALQRQDVLFVAPEGLHRYYLKGTSGRVGASWMTKENRLQDITDYCHLLDAVAQEVYHLQPFERRLILGFSQGVATACRWLVNSTFSFDALINWAGAFPPDLDYTKAYQDLKNVPVHLVLGKQDEFISQAQLEEHLQFIQAQNISFETHLFEGGHSIPEATLSQVLAKVLNAN
jgi:predicted esterase